jgi:hypothetical protein
MPTIDDIRSSKYFSKADVKKGPVKAVIASWKKEEVGPKKETQFVIYFHGDVKPFIVKPSNFHRIATVTGEDDMNDWAGKEITLFLDPSVEFPQGTPVGGVRVAIPGQAVVQQPIDPTPPDDVDVPTVSPSSGDDIPF